MMHAISLMVAAMILLLGCSSKEEKSFTDIYEKNKSYHLQLQKTEKTQLYDGNVTKAMLTATYLFTESADLNDTRDEKFIVGINIEDEEERALSTGDYNLTLAGIPPKNVKLLAHSDPLLKDISFVSDWSQFYLFTFPHTNRKSFTLVFASDLYGKGELHFAKVAKFVLTKEAF